MITRALKRLLLKLDPQSYTVLLPFVGKHIEIALNQNHKLQFEITESGFLIQPGNKHHEPDARLSGSLTAFVQVMRTQKTTSGALNVSGDVACIQALQQYFYQLDPDWENLWGDYLPDGVTYGISTFVKRSGHIFRGLVKQRKADLIAYLQDESQLLPQPDEIADFYSAIDACRADVDRFEAKLKIIEKRLNPANTKAQR